MPLINSPPPRQQLLVHPAPAALGLLTNQPRLVIANVMHHINRTLEMSIRRHILVMRARRAIVCKAHVVPIPKVHIQEALIRTVEANAPLCQRQQRIVVPHVRAQSHHAAVEAVGPANVWSSGKGGLEPEELVGSTDGYDVGVNVYYLSELRLPPKGNLGEGGGEVGSVHEVEVGGRFVNDAVHWYYVVIKGLYHPVSSSLIFPLLPSLYLELVDRRGLYGVESHEYSQLFLGAIVSEGVG